MDRVLTAASRGVNGRRQLEKSAVVGARRSRGGSMGEVVEGRRDPCPLCSARRSFRTRDRRERSGTDRDRPAAARKWARADAERDQKDSRRMSHVRPSSPMAGQNHSNAPRQMASRTRSLIRLRAAARHPRRRRRARGGRARTARFRSSAPRRAGRRQAPRVRRRDARSRTPGHRRR